MKRWQRRGLWAVHVALLTCAALWGGGALRWHQRTAALLEDLRVDRADGGPTTFDERELAPLPPVVQRFFRAALRPGQPLVATARLRQHGTLDLATGGDWVPFTATQHVVARGPAFVWDAVVTVAGVVPVRVHDAYVDGVGRGAAALLGLVPLGTDPTGAAEAAQRRALTEAQLLRFLAEAPWYPTALLPSQGVRWRAVDAQRAEATLTDGDATATVVFTFAADGLVESVRAAARGRLVDGVLVATPWGGRFTDRVERGGMQVPRAAEVFWQQDGEERPCWRGEIAAIDYVWCGAR